MLGNLKGVGVMKWESEYDQNKLYTCIKLSKNTFKILRLMVIRIFTKSQTYLYPNFCIHFTLYKTDLQIIYYNIICNSNDQDI